MDVSAGSARHLAPRRFVGTARTDGNAPQEKTDD